MLMWRFFFMKSDRLFSAYALTAACGVITSQFRDYMSRAHGSHDAPQLVNFRPAVKMTHG